MNMLIRDYAGYVLLLLSCLPFLMSFIAPSTPSSSRRSKSRHAILRNAFLDQYYDPTFTFPQYPVDEHTQYLSKFTCLSTRPSQQRIKVYVLSDLHADAEKNHQWVLNNCMKTQKDIDDDTYCILILPGDIGSEVDRITSIITALVDSYDAVCYIVGNHEAWRRGTARGKSTSATTPELRTITENRMADDSISKISEIYEVVKQSGAHIGPIRVSLHGDQNDTMKEETAVVVTPLQSWYHSSWDREPDLTSLLYKNVEEAMPMARKWGDFSMCSWPDSMIAHHHFASTDITDTSNIQLAKCFASLNEPFITPRNKECLQEIIEGRSQNEEMNENGYNRNKRYVGSPYIKSSDTLITFSHFLPRQELCPEKRFLREPLLTRVIGSDILESQIRRLQSHIHLFGHTHIPIDLELDGVRYIQWPLGYSRESAYQCAPIRQVGPLCVFDTNLGQGIRGIPTQLPSLQCAWTQYYREQDRQAEVVEPLAPWLVSRLEMSGWDRSDVERPKTGDDIAKIR